MSDDRPVLILLDEGDRCFSEPTPNQRKFIERYLELSKSPKSKLAELIKNDAE